MTLPLPPFVLLVVSSLSVGAPPNLQYFATAAACERAREWTVEMHRRQGRAVEAHCFSTKE